MPATPWSCSHLGINMAIKERLPSLEHLSLSAVSFQPPAEEMVCVFNFARLRSLELHNCHARDILQSIAVTGITMVSTSFKITIFWDSPSEGLDPLEPMEVLIAHFLSSFKGLEKLALKLPNQCHWAQVHRGTLNHVSTLKRVVFHRKGNQAYMHGTGDADVPWTNGMDQLAGSRTLASVGISASSPSILVSLHKAISNASFRAGSMIPNSILVFLRHAS